MWIMLNNAFLSIVSKDCPKGSLLVRARRAGDIERVFGPGHKVVRVTSSDYLYRAVVPRAVVASALEREVRRIEYSNFKDSVKDESLHDAYLDVWAAMANVQKPRPYSGFKWGRPRRRGMTN